MVQRATASLALSTRRAHDASFGISLVLLVSVVRECSHTGWQVVEFEPRVAQYVGQPPKSPRFTIQVCAIDAACLVYLASLICHSLLEQKHPLFLHKLDFCSPIVALFTIYLFLLSSIQSPLLDIQTRVFFFF